MAESIPKTQFRKLCTAVRRSYRSLDQFRRKRFEFVQQICGNHYGDGATTAMVPVNYMELADTVYRGNVTPREPRALISTEFDPLRSFAADFELAMHVQSQELGVEEKLEYAVSDAMVSSGLIKLGPVKDDDGRERLRLDNVDFDDYVHDETARRDDEMSFIGNKFWMDKALAAKLYRKPRQVKKLPDVDPQGPNPDGSERISSLSRSDMHEPYRSRVELWEIYLVREKLLVTYGDGDDEPLLIEPWVGPGHLLGPYHRFLFRRVQGNVMPLPPAAKWLDMHRLANIVFRKLGKQAARSKSIGTYQGPDGAKTAARLNKAADGEWIHAQGKVDNMATGQIDRAGMVFMMELRNLISYLWGNIDTLGGLAPQAGTLGQEELLHAGASQPVSQMIDNVHDAAEGLFRAMAWYEFHGPGPKRNLFKGIPGTDLGVNIQWQAGRNMKGRFNEYAIDVELYNLPNTSPQSKLRMLGEVTDRFIAPYIEMLAAQGKSIDLGNLLAQVARLGNLRQELAGIVTPLPPTAQTQTMERTPMSPVTTRRQIREGRSSLNRSSAGDLQMMRSLLNGQADSQEAA